MISSTGRLENEAAFNNARIFKNPNLDKKTTRDNTSTKTMVYNNKKPLINFVMSEYFFSAKRKLILLTSALFIPKFTPPVTLAKERKAIYNPYISRPSVRMSNGVVTIAINAVTV